MENKVNTGSVAVESAQNVASPLKKVAKNKLKTQRIKSSHPPTSEMVNAAIKELKDRKGSSVQAIKKYIAATYKVDGDKFGPFIKRYLKSAVTSGAVLQTKGKGASGSFKLSTGKLDSKVKVHHTPKKSAVKKPQSVEKKIGLAKKPAVKKLSSAKKIVPASGKKAAATKKIVAKTASPAKLKAKPEMKSISKAKKTAKAPAAKTRAPKPKKVAATKTVKASARK